LKSLEENPEKRIQAKEAINHHWFVNFTTKPSENSKLKKFKAANDMSSLLTILESSEISERDIDNQGGQTIKNKLVNKSHYIQQINNEVDEDFVDEENSTVFA
jgi:serine/threonine protein kinase